MKKNPSNKNDLLKFLGCLKRKLFSQSSSINSVVKMDGSELFALKEICNYSKNISPIWDNLFTININYWASWAALNHNKLTWDWYFAPLEPMNEIKQLINEIPFIFIEESSIGKSLIHKELEMISCKANVQAKLSSQNHNEAIPLFAPKYQPLPNSKIYKQHLIEQAKRLIIGVQGLTIFLLDDKTLLLQITSCLAAEFGKRVIYEESNPKNNGIVCCSFTWWTMHQQELTRPEQLIIGELPIANLSSPLTKARVEALKRQGHDWFRELLLPDALNAINKSVIPLRHSSGRLAILDGRLRSRSWGNQFLRTLQPWVPLHRLLPS